MARKRKRRIALWSIGIFLLFLLIGYLVFKSSRVQTFIGKRVTEYFSKRLDTRVEIGRVDIEFPKTIVLDHVYVEDRRQDTLLYANKLYLDFFTYSFRTRHLHFNEIRYFNGRLNINRLKNDTVHNYQFILDEFRADKPRPWKINIDETELDQVHFTYRDEPLKKFVNIHTGCIWLDVDEMDLETQTFVINEAFFDHTRLNFKKLAGEIQTLGSIIARAEAKKEGEEIDLKMDNLTVINSYFNFDDENKPVLYENAIDFSHTEVSEIFAEVENVAIDDEVYTGNIHSISAKEKSGFILRELSGNALVSHQEITVENLNLVTNNSDIQHYFSMRYNSFEDFNDFIHRVTMIGKFDQAKADFDDIAYFAPGLPPQYRGKVFTLSGDVEGTLDRIRGNDIRLDFENSYFAGDIRLTGLPNINETFIDLKAQKLITSYDQLSRILPDANIPPVFDRMGRTIFSGMFTGFITDFVAFGTIHTEIGTLVTDINLKYDRAAKLTTYSGTLSARSFDLGAWFNESELGLITFNAQISGRGLKLNNLDAEILADISSFQFHDYTYNGIDLEGRFERKLFSGSLMIDDAALQMAFEGTVNFTGNVPAFDFNADIEKADLLAMNLTDKGYIISTDIDLDLSGNNFDNIEGEVVAYNTEIVKTNQLDITRGRESFVLDTLHMVSVFDESTGNRDLLIESDIANARITGDFTFNALPVAVAEYLKSYFPSLPYEIKKEVPPQTVSFEIDIRETKNLSELFVPKLEKLQNVKASGIFTSAENYLRLNAAIPEMIYDDKRFEDIVIDIDTKEEFIDVAVSGDKVFITDSFILKDPFITASVRDNMINFNARTGTDTLLNYADISGSLIGREDTLVLHFEPSELILNKEIWEIDPRNSILFAKNFTQINHLTLAHGNEKVTLDYLRRNEETRRLRLTFNDLELGDLTQLAGQVIPVEGIANGTFKYTTIKGDTGFYSDVVISDFTFSGTPLGELSMNTFATEAEDKINIIATITEENKKKADISGFYYTDRPGNNLDFNIQMDEFEVATLEPIFEKFASDLEGTATGNLNLTGTFKRPAITGEALFKNTGFTIDFLGTHYTFDNESVRFYKQFIDLQHIILYDADNNTAEIDGEIYHDNLQNIRLDAFLETDNFMFMNNTEEQNPEFYGKMFGGATIRFSGDVEQLDLYINAQTNKNTHVFIPISEARDYGQYDFIRFIDEDTTEQEGGYKVDLTGLSMEMNLDVTNEARATIILDPLTGESIEGFGTGNLYMNIDTRGEFNMYGTYEITQGDYVFTLQNIINKEFEIQKGSSITWTGNPYEANMNVNAVYRVRASLYDLVANMAIPEEEKSRYRVRVPVFVYLDLTGSLISPTINFDLEVSESGSEINYILRQIEQDQAELNKQVFALLVLNRFLPYGETPVLGDLGPVSTARAGINATVSEFLSQQLTNIGSNIIGDVDLSITYQDYGILGDADDISQRRELQLAVTKRFFNDRLSVQVGGNIGLSERDASEYSGFNEDIVIEYKLTEDGKFRLKLFRKNDYDLFNERLESKTGIGIFYRKEFDEFREIWGERRREEVR